MGDGSEPSNDGTSAKAGASSGERGTRRSKRDVSPNRRKRRIVLEHPDVMGPEFTIRRSFRIQDGVERFLEEFVDTSWESLDDLYIRAANYVWHVGLLKKRPSSVAVGRWVKQFTAVGEKYHIREVKGEGYYVLERRA